MICGTTIGGRSDAGGCGWSAQVQGHGSAQRDYDGTPMITDLMTDEELLAFARVLGERDEGFIDLAHHLEVAGMTEATRSIFENVASVSNRPVLYQVVTSNDNDPSQHRERLRWLEECAKNKLRVGFAE